MRKATALFGALTLAGALQFAGHALAQPAQSEPYRIGIILPMTGSTADYGTDFNRGVQLAEEEINEAGGIGGRPIKLVLGDSKNSAKDGVAEFKRLVEVDKLPAMCVGAITPEIRKAGATVFSNYPLADDEEKEIAEYIVKRLGHKTAAIIYENSAYGKTLSSIFIEEFKKLGGAILAEEVIEKGRRDFRSQITRIGATNPPVTVTYAYYAEGGLIVRQAAELGLKTQFISHGSIQNNSFAEIAGPAADGFISGSPSWDPEAPQVKAYLDHYRKKYNKESDLYGPYFYDAVKLYAEAIKRGGYSKEGILKGLKEIKDFQGVVGKMSFDQGNVVLLPLRFVQFGGGKWNLIQK